MSNDIDQVIALARAEAKRLSGNDGDAAVIQVLAGLVAVLAGGTSPGFLRLPAAPAAPTRALREEETKPLDR